MRLRACNKNPILFFRCKLMDFKIISGTKIEFVFRKILFFKKRAKKAHGFNLISYARRQFKREKKLKKEKDHFKSSNLNSTRKRNKFVFVRVTRNYRLTLSSKSFFLCARAESQN